jgi:hypothetical protein
VNQRYPRIRVTADDGFVYLREVVSLSFYLAAPHSTFASQMLRALERYAATAGSALGYIDEDGARRALDEKCWADIRSQMLDPRGAGIDLDDVDCREERWGFVYRGGSAPHPFQKDAVCGMRCWFPTEYLEQHGPAHLRALAIALLADLPINSGNLGLAIRVLGFDRKGPTLGELALRFPGFAIDDITRIAAHLGTRIRDVSWVTFLGQPVLGAVGEVSGLRAHLHAPGTVVDEIPGDRAAIIIGEWPEAGDTQEGRVLPNYRELAHVLEPFLYRERREHWADDFDSVEELRRVERRFLEP